MHVVNLAGSVVAKLMWVGVFAAGFGSSGCLLSQSCTEAGCRDAASIAVHQSAWAHVPMTFELLVDGRAVKCNSESMAGGTCDDPNVTVDAQERFDCVETRTKDAVSQSCTPNGKYQHLIVIDGTPTRVAVSVTRTGQMVEQREFELEYKTFQPNGPDCEPECRNADVEWEL